MKNTSKTKRTFSRILALVIAMITALSAMSAFTLTASAATKEIEYKGEFEHTTVYPENRVYLKVNGTRGTTGWHYVFGGDSIPEYDFSFTDKNVGEILSYTVHCDVPSTIEGWGQSELCEKIYFKPWAPESITVNGVKIYCNKEINCTDNYTFSLTDNMYEIRIRTADVKNAGTDLNVYIKLYGTDGQETNKINTSKGSVTEHSGKPFNCHEQCSETTITVPADFDRVESFTLSLSGKCIAAKGWKCESVTIQQIQGGTDSGVKKVEINEWFATESDNYEKTFVVPLSQDENNNYLVNDYDDLCIMEAMVNSGKQEYVNGSYVLTNDIDCKGENFIHREMIGTEDISFGGTFDGQGHTISNLNYGSDVEGFDSGNLNGLFGSIGETGTVKNLTVDGATVWGDNSIIEGCGVISNENNGTIENVTVKNSKVQLGDCPYLGGISGINNGTIKNCSVENTTIRRRWGGCDVRGMGCICETNNGTVENCYSDNCKFENGSVSDSTLLILNGNQPV